MKMMEGCSSRAMANIARTSFSVSPTHFDVIADALMLKNVQLPSLATAFACGKEAFCRFQCIVFVMKNNIK